MSVAVSSQPESFILTYECPDQFGVLARVSGLLYNRGAFITEVSQYSDPYTKRFFSRMVFDDRGLTSSIESFTLELSALAQELNMTYRFRPAEHKPKVLIAVSQTDHCLNMLLRKWRSGVLPCDIVGVYSNHEVCRELVEWHGLPFSYLPVDKNNRAEQEAAVQAIMVEQQVDLLVLARYMQILSSDLCEHLAGKAINIHHSFLPGFKGAKPYHQAHARGVKLIGATAHFVTANLDEGPIITQEVKPVNHAHTIEDMVTLGNDIEATVLSHAVRAFCEERVAQNGDKTVVL